MLERLTMREVAWPLYSLLFECESNIQLCVQVDVDSVEDSHASKAQHQPQARILKNATTQHKAISRQVTAMVADLHKLQARLPHGTMEFFLAVSMKPHDDHAQVYTSMSPGVQVCALMIECKHWLHHPDAVWHDSHASLMLLCAALLLFVGLINVQTHAG